MKLTYQQKYGRAADFIKQHYRHHELPWEKRETIAMNKIYAIFDNLAMTITGPLMTFKANAAAIRTFSDIAGDAQTNIGKHPADYDLLQVGHIDDQGNITVYRETVITGEQWLAAQERNTGA